MLALPLFPFWVVPSLVLRTRALGAGLAVRPGLGFLAGGLGYFGEEFLYVLDAGVLDTGHLGVEEDQESLEGLLAEPAVGFG